MDNVIHIDEVYSQFDRLIDKWNRKYPVPIHTLEALARYRVYGYEPGSFLMSVLTNDLFGAMERADNENRRAIFSICQLVYNEFPSTSWHSISNVESYMKEVRNLNDTDSSAN